MNKVCALWMQWEMNISFGKKLLKLFSLNLYYINGKTREGVSVCLISDKLRINEKSIGGGAPMVKAVDGLNSRKKEEKKKQEKEEQTSGNRTEI